MEVIYALLASVSLFVAIYFANLLVRLLFLPQEKLREYREGLGGFRASVWGDNQIENEARCEGLAVTVTGKLKPKTSHGRAAVERLFR